MKYKALIILSDIAVFSAFFWLKHIAAFMISNLSGCVFRKMGFLCPSCGGTRCVYYFFSGDFISSFRMNEFFFVVIIYLLFLILMLNLCYLFKFSLAEKIIKLMINYRTLIFFLLFLCVFTFIRNFVGSWHC